MGSLREWIHRLFGTLRFGRRDADLDDELRLHLEMAADDAARRGLSPDEAARAAHIRSGQLASAMDAMRDQRAWPWLDALKLDVVFSLRHLNQRRTVTGAAILSLAVTIGATTSAFRLVDAVLLRPLPVAEPGRLFSVGAGRHDHQNQPEFRDDFDYPTFQQYSQAAGHAADLMVVGMTARQQVMFDQSTEPERVYRQFVSGNVFGIFGLQPALGRLLAPADDATPGRHPVAVLSHEYWTRRFGNGPEVLGKTFRLGAQVFEVVGVGPPGFTGTEPGRMADVFIPATMNVQALDKPGWSWFRLWVRPKPNFSPEHVRDLLQASFLDEHRSNLRNFAADTKKAVIDAYLSEQILLYPAAAGASNLQRNFRRPLLILAALVTLVLLIACANVANLLGAQAVARARELALRVSIGAGRSRLIQLVLVEAAVVAIAASAAGALFAWWSAPFIVSMLAPPNDPVRLALPIDLRALAFASALTAVVTLVFGLVPAMKAASVEPLQTLKGARGVPPDRRLTGSLIAAQMAFCVFVLLVGWLFVASFERLTSRPLGFSTEDVLVLETEIRGAPQPSTAWADVAAHLRQLPGVEAAAASNWALLSGNGWTVSVRGEGSLEPRGVNALSITPGFLNAMRIDLIDGRDVRPGDVQPWVAQEGAPRPGVGIVNETFARTFFGGRNPVGKSVLVRQTKDTFVAMEIVGLVRDTAYRNVRDPFPPMMYVPLENRGNGAIVVRTASDPMQLASVLRSEVSRARSDFVVRNAGTQAALVRSLILRERLLATLSSFFAAVALLLAGVGLYGVLNYAVVQQRRDIGVRMALGARAQDVVKHVATNKLTSVAIGATIGGTAGLGFGRMVEALLYEVKPTDPSTFGVTVLALAATAVIATLSPALRAVRIDPAETLRAE